MADHSEVYSALLQRKADQTAPLAVVRPHASCVLPAPVTEVWEAHRLWAPLTWLPSLDGREVAVTLESGGNSTIGAVRRVQIGEQVYFEQLIAIDDEDRIMKWRLISHPDTVNPFTASFVNFICTAKIYPVTVGNETFIDYKGEFLTEVQHTQGMKNTFERWFITAFQSLQDHISAQKSQQQSKQQQYQAGSTQHGSRSMSPQGSAGTESGHGRAQNEQTRQQPQPQFTRVGSNAPVRCVPSHDAITLQGINYHQNKHHNSDVNMQHSRSPQLFNSNSSDGRGAPNAASGYKTHLSGE